MESGNKQTPHSGTKFISLSGKKQCGKDTAGKMIAEIVNSRGKTYRMSSFAEPLKEMCINILGLKREYVYGTDEQKNLPCHIQWDGFPMEVRLKYSNEFADYDGSNPPYDMTQQALPRIGNMTNREVLQVMGTDIFRTIYGDVWAKAPFNRDWEDVDYVILTDCRFPNEKFWTEYHGGVTIRLERDTGSTDNHPSETALDDVVFKNKYDNNGTLEDLQRYLANVIS